MAPAASQAQEPALRRSEEDTNLDDEADNSISISAFDPTSSLFCSPSPIEKEILFPVKATTGTASPTELLRRLSLDKAPDVDPRQTYPDLNLSGNVISATFCIPSYVTFSDSAEWILTPRHGTSALFDAFRHLSSPKSPWNHTLIGWTGEIRVKEKEPWGQTHEAKSNGQGQCKGISISKSDRERLEHQLATESGIKQVPVWMSGADASAESGEFCLEDQARWRRYAEYELFTLFHYKQNEPTDGRAERQWWADYCSLNQRFADAILAIHKPGDIVWVHDYHLLLLPAILRQRLPSINIAFYLHVPFPSSEYVRGLKRRKDVLEGMLGANMIGFQSYSYSRHFSSCCTRILGFDSSPAGVDAYGAHVAVDCFPIGIDAPAIEKIAFGDSGVDGEIAALRERYAGKKIIVGRDRLDSVRGVAQKLQAFEVFLQQYPEWREKVVLIQVTSPTSVEAEKEDAGHKIANRVSEMVSRINSLYGSLSHSPVQHHPQYVSKAEYFALLRVSDVGLITSVRDGMNTTSLEYVICQREKHGPVILSEFSGTASTLASAIHINPWDLSGVADSINRALTMSEEEKQEQHKKLYAHVTKRTVQAWTKVFLDRLLTNLSSFNQTTGTPLLDTAALLAQYRQSESRLFLFDYDGTLTPIVKEPSAAIPTDRVIRTIKSLAANPRNAVWIISGRDQDFLNQWMGDISELGLVAEHGSFMRSPRKDEWENLAEKYDMGWQKEVMEVFQSYTERTQGSFIERKRIALTWHYRRADPEYGAFQASECKQVLEKRLAGKWEVEVMTGKANLEVRPKFVNKGEIAKRLVGLYGTKVGAAPELVLCLGDDMTDEYMFRALEETNLPRQHVFSVTVGASSKITAANWHLLETKDVISTISLLNSEGNSGDTSG
ncbi:MAG: hypothetical protein M1825_006492 [Sarcosagium campestre]|nr:MAG: hypothetical protein M1825_006492 [Sarcosagium campestre]